MPKRFRLKTNSGKKTTLRRLSNIKLNGLHAIIKIGTKPTEIRSEKEQEIKFGIGAQITENNIGNIQESGVRIILKSGGELANAIQSVILIRSIPILEITVQENVGRKVSILLRMFNCNTKARKVYVGGVVIQ